MSRLDDCRKNIRFTQGAIKAVVAFIEKRSEENEESNDDVIEVLMEAEAKLTEIDKLLEMEQLGRSFEKRAS